MVFDYICVFVLLVVSSYQLLYLCRIWCCIAGFSFGNKISRSGGRISFKAPSNFCVGCVFLGSLRPWCGWTGHLRENPGWLPWQFSHISGFTFLCRLGALHVPVQKVHIGSSAGHYFWKCFHCWKRWHCPSCRLRWKGDFFLYAPPH